MPTYEQAIEALRKADEAGNVEDAKKLAVIAKRLKEQKPQEVGGVMPFVNKAIAETYGAPADLIQKGLNLIPGVNLPEPFGGSRSIKKGMEMIDAPTPKEGREPETVPEYIGQGVGEVASFIIPAAKATQVISRGAGVASKIAQNINKGMVKHPYLTMISEATGGVGAGFGRGVAETQDAGAGTKASAEVAGGIIGGTAPVLSTYAPLAMLLRQGKRILTPFTKAGTKYRAGKYIKEQVVSPDKTISELSKDSISELPPAVQSGEKRLITLYKSFIAQDPVDDADAVEEIGQSIVKLTKEMKKLGYGSPELLAEVTQKRVAALELKMDKRLMDAVQKAKGKFDALSVAGKRVDESRVVRREVEGLMRQEKADVDRLWQEVPKDFEVGVDKTRSTFQLLLEDLPEAQRVDIPFPLKKSSIIINDKIEAIPLREMQGLRSKLLEVSRKARKDGQWNKSRIAEDMADAILEDIGIAGGEAVSPESAALQTALAATKQFKMRYESGIVGKLLGYSKSGTPSIDPDLTLDVAIGSMGNKAGVNVGKITITPEAKAATKRYIARSYADFAVNKTDNTINPIKHETWLKNNEAILDQFPELRQQLTDIEKAQSFANETRAVMEARKKAIQSPSIKVASEFTNISDMIKGVDNILKTNNMRMANELVRMTRKDPSGQALEGLRGGFINYLFEKSTVGPFNDAGEQVFSGKTLLGLVNKSEKVLREIFDPKQIARIKKIGSELVKIESFSKAPETKAEIEMKDLASQSLSLLARITGARLGGYMGRESAGGSLQMAQIYSGLFKRFVSRVTRDRARELIHDAIISKDPDLLKSLLMPIEKPSLGGMRENLKFVTNRMNLWLAGSGKRIIEDIKAESQPENVKKYIVIGNEKYENLGKSPDGGIRIRDPKTGDIGSYFLE